MAWTKQCQGKLQAGGVEQRYGARPAAALLLETLGMVEGGGLSVWGDNATI